MAAPWEVNEQVEAAEKKQELREALRKKLKQQKMSRSNRTALEAKEERDSAAAAGGGGGSAADLSSAMENLDSSMLQALAARMGVAPDKMPNKRKIERMLKGMSVTEMMARAKGRTGK